MTPEPGAAAGRVDGRRVRGERRRSAIIAATLAVVERDGVAGVSHRAVAREAGVPASSALYYFATLDDLLVAALTAAAEEYARQFDALCRRGNDPLAVANVVAAADGICAQVLLDPDGVTPAEIRAVLRHAVAVTGVGEDPGAR